MSESVPRGAGETEGDGREDSSEPEYAEESEVEVEVLRPERRGDEETEDEGEGGEENSIGESDSEASVMPSARMTAPIRSRQQSTMTAIEWAIKRRVDQPDSPAAFRLTAGATSGIGQGLKPLKRLKTDADKRTWEGVDITDDLFRLESR
jgi:hypothetical protein